LEETKSTPAQQYAQAAGLDDDPGNGEAGSKNETIPLECIQEFVNTLL
jgi:hypothetical protein